MNDWSYTTRAPTKKEKRYKLLMIFCATHVISFRNRFFVAVFAAHRRTSPPQNMFIYARLLCIERLNLWHNMDYYYYCYYLYGEWHLKVGSRLSILFDTIPFPAKYENWKCQSFSFSPFTKYRIRKEWTQNRRLKRPKSWNCSRCLFGQSNSHVIFVVHFGDESREWRVETDEQKRSDKCLSWKLWSIPIQSSGRICICDTHIFDKKNKRTKLCLCVCVCWINGAAKKKTFTSGTINKRSDEWIESRYNFNAFELCKCIFFQLFGRVGYERSIRLHFRHK